MPHYNANAIHKEYYPREIWIGYNIELAESVYWAMKTHILRVGQLVEFREWNETMKMMWAAEIQILYEYMIVAVVIAISAPPFSL